MDRELRKQVRADFYEWKRIVKGFNRFDIKSPLLSVLESNIDLISIHIHEGQSFFRGRIFNLEDKITTDEEYLAFVESDEKIFQGYNKYESGAPLSALAIEGRLNCNGISFLYTCNDKKTVIYELRPIKSELISIAEFVTKRELCFADLRKSSSKRFSENEVLATLLRKISAEFSKPHYAGHKYWFTQYLAGQFINMGFDGVIFESSLLPEGDNIVFFYPDDCEAINSRLYKVDKISISFNDINREDSC